MDDFLKKVSGCIFIEPFSSIGMPGHLLLIHPGHVLHVIGLLFRLLCCCYRG